MSLQSQTPANLAFELSRNAHGRLTLRRASDGVEHVGVLPVRAYPISAPNEGLSLFGTDGHELIWIDHIDQLSADQRQLIEDELAAREFVPTIQRILNVSTFATPSTWTVETDRGPFDLVLKAEEDIRKLEGRTHLLITASDGLQFRVRDSNALDKHSRKLLSRFL
ncbi:cyanophycin metabolism-associated DUF1854 family protein [Diaphorobacter aerolatus]|uniref:DUF1854 domain-containing protein n=1 Tax=Diaphorobacter aerolatus TaxID=1288495 RepID=A0A7H0GNN3_9BURK|nr:DUF1854 domain-containing protein [Diaphorobacter aerolatus]QNP49899.1 DUF1854 domain-containing protein [Diaphorobacter aerolatus]